MFSIVVKLDESKVAEEQKSEREKEAQDMFQQMSSMLGFEVKVRMTDISFRILIEQIKIAYNFLRSRVSGSSECDTRQPKSGCFECLSMMRELRMSSVAF